MNSYAYQTKEHKGQSVANTVSQNRSGNRFAMQFTDNRPESSSERQLQQVANGSPQARQIVQLQELANGCSNQSQVNQVRAPLPLQVIQREHYPDDSRGTTDTIIENVQIPEAEGMQELTGSQLQGEILSILEAGGDCRVGTFAITDGLQIGRAPDPYVEDHRMPPLPADINIGQLDTYLIPYIRGTLRAAGQLGYIAHNWATINRTHDVVVDVDVQFDRTQNNVGFHKDSRGHTVFVNLTYNNEGQIFGPEYYEDVLGDEGMERNLPAEVGRDLETRRAGTGADDVQETMMSILEKNARVSFSDPSIWHSTPQLARRGDPFPDPLNKDTGIEFLKSLYPDEYHESIMGFDEEVVIRTCNDLKPTWINYHSKENASSMTAEELEDKKQKQVHRPRSMSTYMEDYPDVRETMKAFRGLPRTFIRTWVRMIPRNLDFYGDQHTENDMWGAINESGHAEQEGLVNDLFN